MFMSRLGDEAKKGRSMKKIVYWKARTRSKYGFEIIFIFQIRERPLVFLQIIIKQAIKSNPICSHDSPITLCIFTFMNVFNRFTFFCKK
jgi:hypothetical protein